MATNSIENKARAVTAEASPWIERLARLGYLAKGIVYLVIGILALQASQGAGKANINQSDAFRNILTQPFGQVLLIIMVVGFAGYALWKFVQAITNPEGKGGLHRLGYVITGLGHVAIALAAVQLLTGNGGASGANATQDWTARLLQQSWGPALVMLIGLAIIGVGLAHLYQAYTASFQKRLQANMKPEERKWAITSGRMGLIAQGIVYGIIGFFLIQAGMQHDPGKAGGLGQAFEALISQPYGPWLLAAVAIGFVAYGMYAAMLARYGRVQVA